VSQLRDRNTVPAVATCVGAGAACGALVGPGEFDRGEVAFLFGAALGTQGSQCLEFLGSTPGGVQ
jgi:hypothetical protein